MENLTEPLTEELEFQTQNPFLLYRNAKCEIVYGTGLSFHLFEVSLVSVLIYGIWFYDQEDCRRIGETLEKWVVLGYTVVTNMHKFWGVK